MPDIQTTTRAMLIDRLWPAGAQPLARAAILVLTGSALLWASAKVQVPMWPVPITMQSYVVLVIGMAYGGRLAAATVGIYLLEGALGLPVFAGTPARGIGVAYMIGPTGGYLVGFLIAAAAMGWLAGRGFDRSVGRALAAMSLGLILLFAPGVAWLATFVGFDKALAVGVMPFLPGEALKLALAAVTLPIAWKFAGSPRE
jgi:biotin transport system substrate-specific component